MTEANFLTGLLLALVLGLPYLASQCAAKASAAPMPKGSRRPLMPLPLLAKLSTALLTCTLPQVMGVMHLRTRLSARFHTAQVLTMGITRAG